MKCCIGCKETKELTEFNKDKSRLSGYKERCKKCINYNRKIKGLNYTPAKIAWNKANKKKCKEYKRLGYEKMRAEGGIRKNNKLPTCPILKKEATLARNRYQEWWKRILNVEYNVKKNIRIRLNKALKGSFKNSSAWVSAGCSESFLKQHLISQFTGNMTWDGYGDTWELDHIIPLSFFNLTKESHIKIACHYSNLKPISRLENMKKGRKIQDVAALLMVNVKLIGVDNEIY